jgi:hypothetical protein
MKHQWSTKNIIKIVDRTLIDILNNSEPFGGNVFVFGEDFRQVLPVVSSNKTTNN